MDYTILKEQPGHGFVATGETITVANAEEAQAAVESRQMTNGGCYAAQHVPGT